MCTQIHIHSKTYMHIELPHGCENQMHAPRSDIWDPPQLSLLFKASYSLRLCHHHHTQAQDFTDLPTPMTAPSIQVFTQQLYSFPSFHKLMSCHCPRPHYELSIALNKKPELLPMIYRAPDGSTTF